MIAKNDLRLIKSILKNAIRKSNAMKHSKEFKLALDQLDNESRALFIEYYINDKTLINIALKSFYDESVIRHRVDEATILFIHLYANGIFEKMFIEN